jgi:hypothetical protein
VRPSHRTLARELVPAFQINSPGPGYDNLVLLVTSTAKMVTAELEFSSDSIKLRIPLEFQKAAMDWFSNSTRLSQVDDLISLCHFFKYLTSQCYQASHFTSIKTYSQLLEIAADLKNEGSRADILKRLVASSVTDGDDDFEEMCESSIDLVVRSLLMLDVGAMRHAYTGRRPLLWRNGTLQDFIKLIFPSSQILDHSGLKLGSTFTARNLDKIAGIKIRWTPNLADHLRVTESDDCQTLSIFHHSSFLQYQYNNLIFPPGFVQETIQTIKLLFPRGDRQTVDWYQKAARVNDLDLNVIHCGSLRADERQLEHFCYWHDRLVILKQVFDDSRPSTLSQWWHDRRNGVQWYTFWLVVLGLGLTVLFGIIQGIEGALQVYKAYHPTLNSNS